MEAARTEELRLSLSLHLGWGVGSFGASTLINGVSFLALFYFTEQLGIAPAIAGSLLFLAKFYSIAADPLIGILSDRRRGPGSRRRPLLFVGALLAGSGFVALFHAPAIAGTWLIAWCAGALLVYATGYSLYVIPYLAMPAEMTASQHERSRLMAARVVFASLGILAGGALAPALATAAGGGRSGYATMSLVLTAAIVATMLIAWAATAGARSSAWSEAGAGAREQLRRALANRPFAFLLGSKFLHLTGVSISNSALLYLLTLVLGRAEGAAALFGGAAVAGTLVSMPLWLALCRQIGKRNTYVCAVVAYVPITLTWLAADAAETDVMLALRGLAIGLATGGLTLTAQSMLPDAIAHDTERTGLHREGSFTAVYSATEKLAAALGPLVLGIVLSANVDAASAVRNSAAWLPAAASALSALALLGYSLDRHESSRG